MNQLIFDHGKVTIVDGGVLKSYAKSNVGYADGVNVVTFTLLEEEEEAFEYETGDDLLVVDTAPGGASETINTDTALLAFLTAHWNRYHGTETQADYTQTDRTHPGYIKNKPAIGMSGSHTFEDANGITWTVVGGIITANDD